MVFSSTIFLDQSKKSINFDFDQQQKVQTPNSHYPNTAGGGSDRGEVDIDSDENLLASGKLRQSTTVPSQCERLPYP